MSSLRDKIKAAAAESAKLRKEKRPRVIVPEWGLTEDAEPVYVGVLSVGKRDEFEEGLRSAKGEADLKDYRAKFVALLLQDADGNPIFEDVADVKWLSQEHSAIIEPVFVKCQAFNGIGVDHRKNS